MVKKPYKKIGFVRGQYLANWIRNPYYLHVFLYQMIKKPYKKSSKFGFERGQYLANWIKNHYYLYGFLWLMVKKPYKQ